MLSMGDDASRVFRHTGQESGEMGGLVVGAGDGVDKCVGKVVIVACRGAGGLDRGGQLVGLADEFTGGFGVKM